MSEIILTFQSQLSGVMETVFKAAIFEITRLVEDSFLEEMTRNREQVESLKKKLQWSESKGRRRCAECGNNKLSGEEKQEKPAAAQTGRFVYSGHFLRYLELDHGYGYTVVIRRASDGSCSFGSRFLCLLFL